MDYSQRVDKLCPEVGKVEVGMVGDGVVDNTFAVLVALVVLGIVAVGLKGM